MNIFKRLFRNGTSTIEHPVDHPLSPIDFGAPVPVGGMPEYMYVVRPDGTEVRAKVLGVHPVYGYLVTSKGWEVVSS
jgi:hypothetical protein